MNWSKIYIKNEVANYMYARVLSIKYFFLNIFVYAEHILFGASPVAKHICIFFSFYYAVCSASLNGRIIGVAVVITRNRRRM